MDTATETLVNSSGNIDGFMLPINLAFIVIVGVILLLLIILYKAYKLDLDEIVTERVYNKVKEDKSFLSLSKQRYSVRDFNDIKVSDIQLATIVEAGRIAPTSNNCQSQRVFVMKTDIAKEKIQKCCNIYNAPLAILVCYDKDKYSDGKNLGEIDATIVATQMMNSATSLEIGSLWITNFSAETIAEEYGLQNNIVPVCVLAIGYPKIKEDRIARYKTEREELNKTVKIY